MIGIGIVLTLALIGQPVSNLEVGSTRAYNAVVKARQDAIDRQIEAREDAKREEQRLLTKFTQWVKAKPVTDKKQIARLKAYHVAIGETRFYAITNQDISVPEMLTAMDKVAKPQTARAKTARAKARKQAGQ